MGERTGMRTFFVVWSGQFVSLIGTNLTGIALAIWVFQETGSTTKLALVLFASQVPQLLATPIAGALADRFHYDVAQLAPVSGEGFLVVAALAVGTLAAALPARSALRIDISNTLGQGR